MLVRHIYSGAVARETVHAAVALFALLPMVAFSQTHAYDSEAATEMRAAGQVSSSSALAHDITSKIKMPSEDADKIDKPVPGGLLTLDSAVAIAVNRHPEVVSALAQVEQARVQIDVAKSGYFPQVTAGVGGGNNSLTGSGKTTSVQISQMIYDFGKTSGAVDQARATVKRQQALTLKEVQSIEQQTADAVINVHRYQALVDIAQKQVEAVTKVYQMSLLRANAGVSTRSDPIQAETRVQNAKANLIGVQSELAQSEQKLRTLLGGPFGGKVADLPEAKADSLEMMATPDTTQMPDVIAAQADELVAQDQLTVAKANRLPTVSLDYTLNKNIAGVNSSTFVRHGSDHTLMLNLQWTLYKGGALNAEVKAANHALTAARYHTDAARLDGSDAARAYREQALGAKGRMSVMAERTRSIAEARDLYREQYKLGSRSILDLLNAEQEYYQASSDEQAVLHDYWTAVVGYVGATGMGSEFYGVDVMMASGAGDK